MSLSAFPAYINYGTSISHALSPCARKLAFGLEGRKQQPPHYFTEHAQAAPGTVTSADRHFAGVSNQLAALPSRVPGDN